MTDCFEIISWTWTGVAPCNSSPPWFQCWNWLGVELYEGEWTKKYSKFSGRKCIQPFNGGEIIFFWFPPFSTFISLLVRFWTIIFFRCIFKDSFNLCNIIIYSNGCFFFFSLFFSHWVQLMKAKLKLMHQNESVICTVLWNKFEQI